MHGLIRTNEWTASRTVPAAIFAPRQRRPADITTYVRRAGCPAYPAGYSYLPGPARHLITRMSDYPELITSWARWGWAWRWLPGAWAGAPCARRPWRPRPPRPRRTWPPAGPVAASSS